MEARHIYSNLTNTPVILTTPIAAGTAEGSRVIEKCLITNTDTETVQATLTLYQALASPTTIYILYKCEIKVGETLDVFPDTPIAFDDYYSLRAQMETGQTADIIIN